MRDYSVVTPAFWIGETGKKLRGDANAQLLAMYLMTSPHSTMTGVFHCPVLYMAHETGIPSEGASKALARLCEVGFCEYEESSETVFVVRMASYQIAESLKPGDNRIIGLKKEVAKMASPLMKSRFVATYSVAFCLSNEAENTSPSKAPPKPRTGTGTGTRTGDIPPADESADLPGFAKFWETWPTNDRKQAKGKCLDAWKKASAERDAALVLAHVSSLKNSAWLKDGGQFVPAPLVYLNQRRWEGADASDGTPTGGIFAGAI